MFIRKFAVAVATLVGAVMLFAAPASAAPGPTAQFFLPPNPNISGALSFYQSGTPPLILGVNVHPVALTTLPSFNQSISIPNNPIIGAVFSFQTGPLG